MTLIGLMAGAVAALFLFVKVLVDQIVRSKDAEISDLRERVDRYEALVTDLLDVAQTTAKAAKRGGE
jgi:hypothetical protein